MYERRAARAELSHCGRTRPITGRVTQVARYGVQTSCSLRFGLVVAFLGGVMRGAPAVAQSSWGRQSPTRLVEAKRPIQDNSFLIEEAYNQESGVVQHISTFSHSRSKSRGPVQKRWPRQASMRRPAVCSSLPGSGGRATFAQACSSCQEMRHRSPNGVIHAYREIFRRSL